MLPGYWGGKMNPAVAQALHPMAQHLKELQGANLGPINFRKQMISRLLGR